MVKANQTEFAELMGWTKGYVSQLKQAGRLVFSVDGKVDVEASKIKIAETEDPNRDDVKARHANERASDSKVNEIGSHTATGKSKKDKEPKDPSRDSFSQSRAKEQQFKALEAELDYQERIGKLVARDAMKDAIGDMVTTFRQNLENMPHRISAELVGKDINDIRITLKQAVHHVLTQLEKGCNDKLNQSTQEQS